jgi:hypothetical protein
MSRPRTTDEATLLHEITGTGGEREIELVLQTLSLVVPDHSGTYLAGPISTGRRYYDALAETGAADLDALIAAVGERAYLEQVRWPNVRDGEELAMSLRENGVPYVVNTGPLHVRGWSGADYMVMCLRLIERKIAQVYMHPHWAYSNGAVQEFAFCQNRGITTFTAAGTPLSRDDGLREMRAARKRLEEIGVDRSWIDVRIEEVGSEVEEEVTSPPVSIE